MQRRSTLVLIAAATSAALAAGCGGGSSGGSGSNDSSQPPAAELTSATKALGDASTLTTSLKLGATTSQISALAASNGGSGLSPAEVSAIAGAQVSVEVAAPSGKTLSDLNNGGAAVNVTISDNGTSYLALRKVASKLYVQIDLKDLLNTLGQASTYAQLQNAPGAPAFLTALVAGKWISLPDSAATSLSAAGGASPKPQWQRVIDGLKNIVTGDVTATRASSGTTDDLVLTADSRTVVKDFLAAISSAVPSAASALVTTDPNRVPSQPVTLGAQVTGGALSQLSIDLGQFDQTRKAHLPVVVDFARSGPAITAPSGAVAVNTQELGQLLGSFAGGLGG